MIENAAGDRRAARMVAQWLHNDGPMRQWRYLVARMRLDPGDADDLDEMLDDLDEGRNMRRPKRRSGLAKKDLGKNKNGKVVSKKKSAKGEKPPEIAACSAARALNIKGVATVGSKKKSAKGSKVPRIAACSAERKALNIKGFAKVVSKKKSAKGEKSPRIAACSAAKKALNIKGVAKVASKKKSAKEKRSPMDRSMQRSQKALKKARRL